MWDGSSNSCAGKKKGKKGKDDTGLAWSWSDLAALVKFSKYPIQVWLD